MEIYNLSLHELRDMLKSKKISSYEATLSCLSRIDDVDRSIGSFLSVFYDDAKKSAIVADKKIASGETSPLLGVPYALKDNILTKGIVTTCASLMLKDFVPPYSATVYEKLMSAGGILLGKLNMDEFAMGSSTETSAYKTTKNPYNITKIPGGSSGGSATAVAADESFFTLGTDTGGSIRQPAAFCGCVGLKPTYGTISRYGLVAFASSLDQIGPMTKDVKDAAIVLDVIAGKDNRDCTTYSYKPQSCEESLTGDIKNLKIGVPVQYLDGINEEVYSALTKAVENIKSMGAEVTDTDLKMYKYALPAYYLISSGEASSNLARFTGVGFGFRADNYSDLGDMYKESRAQGFGDEVKRRIMLGTYILSSENYSAYYKKAQQVRTLIIEEFNKLFEKFDVLITPAYPTTATDLGRNITSIEMYRGGNCLVCTNLAGLPSIVLPCGYDNSGLPIGIQIIGKPFCESTILNVAYALEKTITKQKPLISGGVK